MLLRTSLFLLALFSLPLSASEPLTIGSRPQLFVDDRFIAEQTGLTRVPVSVTKSNAGQAILENGRLYGTVLHDGTKFRFWCRNPETGYHYAESSDGLHFQRIGEVTGIPFAGDYTLAVEFDRPALDGSRRFMAGFDAPGMAAGIAVSTDGLNWSPINQGKPVTDRAADTYNQILWDPTANTYRLLTRTDYKGGGGPDELRGHRTMVNKDPWRNPTNWKTVGEWNLDGTGKRRQIYAATHWIYEGYHFALLSVYEWPSDFSEGPTDNHKRHEKDIMNTYLVTSHDGVHWNMDPVERGLPFIPRGPDGSFDKDLLLPASTVVTWQNRHWLYYSGANERHGNPDFSFPRRIKIGLASFPVNRIYALAPVETTGSLTTKPFLCGSAGITVNLDASAGWAKFELLDEAGEPLLDSNGSPRTTTVSGIDATHHPLLWTSGEVEQGTIVRLRTTLHGARLYAFQLSSGTGETER